MAVSTFADLPAPPQNQPPEPNGRDAKRPADNKTRPQNPEPSPAAGAHRGVKKRRQAKVDQAAETTRYFLTSSGNNGKPELERELKDENEAIIEALKQDRTFIIMTEWRPKVDNSTKGQPVIAKEAVVRSHSQTS